MGLYGGMALIMGFLGLLGMLNLVPRPLMLTFRLKEPFMQRLGIWMLVSAAIILVVGGVHVSMGGHVENIQGAEAFGRMATQQIVGAIAVFGLFGGAAFFLGRRFGFLNMGESVKYRVLQNEDPADWTAVRPVQPGEERLVWIPLMAMAVMSVFLAIGILVTLYGLRP